LAVKDELRDDLLHPGGSRLGVGSNDDVIISELQIVPDRGIEVMAVHFPLLAGPFELRHEGAPA
jgi:hypothetical protein